MRLLTSTLLIAAIITLVPAIASAQTAADEITIVSSATGKTTSSQIKVSPDGKVIGTGVAVPLRLTKALFAHVQAALPFAKKLARGRCSNPPGSAAVTLTYRNETTPVLNCADNPTSMLLFYDAHVIQLAAEHPELWHDN